MTNFTHKTIEATPRVCLRLKEAREKAGFSVEEMAKKTRLSKKYIEALESCEFEKLPHGAVYKKNFIRQYLSVLHIPCASHIQQFLMEEENRKGKTSEQTHPHKPQSLSTLRTFPNLLQYISVSAIFCIVLGYLGWQVHRIVQHPILTLITPVDGHVTSDDFVIVRGTSEPEIFITINGMKLSIAEQGNFEQELDLVEGVNTIVVSATKKHGKTTTETRYVTQRPVQKISIDSSIDNNS